MCARPCVRVRRFSVWLLLRDCVRVCAFSWASISSAMRAAFFCVLRADTHQQIMMHGTRRASERTLLCVRNSYAKIFARMSVEIQTVKSGGFLVVQKPLHYIQSGFVYFDVNLNI